MIVKFFKRGTGKASGVFDYLLKDNNEPGGKRQEAELLRGDVVNQSILIDSLDFKQKYTSGCLSFAESPEEVTQEQKEQLMDSFEETIRAGLDSDRISIVWVEHRDKGRLELNFVFANVDLKHGRGFQPYVHSQDKKRINAWKDMANIEHGFKDPSDPANKRLMAQRDNLPRDVKDARQAITEGLTAMVVEGVIKSRDDVIQALTDGGFEIARETPKAISIKNPQEGGRNIRLTGGLYERDFKFSRAVQAETERASTDYRATARQRFESAKQLYHSETQRKREYHQKRHSRPKREQRGIARAVNPAFSRYTPYSGRYALTVPNPFIHTLRKPSKRSKRDYGESYKPYSTAYTEQRGQDKEGHNIRHREVDDHRSDNFIYGIRSRDFTRVKNEQQTHNLQVLSRQQNRSDLHATNAGLKQYEQTAPRTSTASTDSTARHDTATRANAQRQRQLYSRVGELAKTVNNNANRANTTLTEVARGIEEHHSTAEKTTEYMVISSQRTSGTNEYLIERVNEAIRESDSTNSAYERLSEYDSTARAVRERYTAVGERIERYSKFTDKNNEQAELTQRTATELAKTAANIEIAREKEQTQQQEVRANQSYRPRMR